MYVLSGDKLETSFVPALPSANCTISWFISSYITTFFCSRYREDQPRLSSTQKAIVIIEPIDVVIMLIGKVVLDTLFRVVFLCIVRQIAQESFRTLLACCHLVGITKRIMTSVAEIHKHCLSCGINCVVLSFL